MKKALFILVLIMSFELFGQHPDLVFSTKWYVKSITVDSVETNAPSDLVYFPFAYTIFFGTGNYITSKNKRFVYSDLVEGWCDMGFNGHIQYSGIDTFSFSDFTLINNTDNCSVDLQNFMNPYISIFTDGINNDFTYTISDLADGTKELIITNFNGNSITYSNRFYNPTPSNLTTNYWYLNNLQIGGVANLPPNNLELLDYPAFMSFLGNQSESYDDGNIASRICIVDMQMYSLYFPSSLNEFYFYDMTFGIAECSFADNISYRELYFNFFEHNAPGPFTYELTNNDTTLTITAPNGDYAVYGNYPVSTTDNTINTKMVLYPNPTTNTFKIETTQNIKKVEIYSVLGKLVQTYSKQTVYDISHLSSGVYSVVIDNVFYTVLVKR